MKLIRRRALLRLCFKKKDYSKAKKVSLENDVQNPIWIVDLLKKLGSVVTTSDAKRLIEAGAVSIDDKKITEFKDQVEWSSGMVVKVGKHKIYTLA